MHSYKLLLATTAACLTAASAAAQDECLTAIAAPIGATAFDTTTGTLSPEPWACAASTSPDLWFTTLAGGFPITIDLCGSTFDTALSVYDGTCAGLNLLLCNDDSCALQSSVTLTPAAGTLLYIRVGGFGASAAGPGTLNITDSFSPPNDECAGAIVAVEGVNPTYSNVSATTSSPAWPCALGGRDLWFRYTPTFSGDFTIDTCAAGTTFDTSIELFEGACGALTSAVCNDDSCGLRSSITYCGEAGTTYLFRVGGFFAQSGTFEMTITAATNPADPNRCATSLFAGANGGSVGGGVYFDATFTEAGLVSLLATNTSIAVGTVLTADIYTNPAGYIGNQATAVGWTLRGTARGVSAGLNLPSWLTLDAPIAFGAGTVGVAIHAVNFNHRYTNGNGTNQTGVSPDGVITLSLGSASNVLFTAPTFNPRVWNGILCRAQDIGTAYCPATNNSTGVPGVLIAGGSNCVAQDSLVLLATRLPLNSFGYFLCSTTPGLSMPPGSQGSICLGGNIGRGVGGGIYNTGSSGTMFAQSSLTLPHPSLGTVQVMAGETWNYQAWHRDSVGGVATSNTTNATAVTYD